MLSESPAVGSGHGHRRGRASAGNGLEAPMGPSAADAPSQPNRTARPSAAAPSPRGRRELLPAQEDGRTDRQTRLRGRAERGSSSSGTAWRAAPSWSPSPAPQDMARPRHCRRDPEAQRPPRRHRHRRDVTRPSEPPSAVCPLALLLFCFIFNFLFSRRRRPDPCHLCCTSGIAAACERFLLREARSTGTTFFVFYEQGPYFCGRRIVTGTA